MTVKKDAKIQVLEVLDPVSTVAAKTIHPAHRLHDLSSRRIGLYSNTKSGADVGLEEVARLLEGRFQNLKFEKFSYSYPHGRDALEKVAKSGCDAIISASAD